MTVDSGQRESQRQAQLYRTGESAELRMPQTELTALRVKDIQQSEEHWGIVDLEPVINFPEGGVQPRRAKSARRGSRSRKSGQNRGPRGLCPWGGDEAEPEGGGGTTVEGENEVWPDFRRKPSGGAGFSDFCLDRR